MHILQFWGYFWVLFVILGCKIWDQTNTACVNKMTNMRYGWGCGPDWDLRDEGGLPLWRRNMFSSCHLYWTPKMCSRLYNSPPPPLIAHFTLIKFGIDEDTLNGWRLNTLSNTAYFSPAHLIAVAIVFMKDLLIYQTYFLNYLDGEAVLRMATSFTWESNSINRVYHHK